MIRSILILMVQAILMIVLTLTLLMAILHVLLIPLFDSSHRPANRSCLHVQIIDRVQAVSKTTATLQVVANPLLNAQTSPVASQIFQQLRDMPADLVRYVPWFPYPQMGVAELEPPAGGSTSWHFCNPLVQLLNDTFQAVTASNGRIVINFSAQPTWMFNTTDWPYPKDPNQVVWEYPRGHVRRNTVALVAQYYGRLASWVVHGYFWDELGRKIEGGPAWGQNVTHWEVFNEPEMEHELSWQEYNLLYDAIVREIRLATGKVTDITFVGMALAGHREWNYWKGFLTPSNHDPDVRDAIANGMASFHWYGRISSRTNLSTFVEPFSQLPKFLEEIDQIIDIRNELSPNTQLALNEVGVIPVDDNLVDSDPLPPVYYNMAAAVYTVLVSELSIKGVDLVGSSQLSGFPVLPEWNLTDAQFPGVSMTNWTTGNGNPRYWALKLYNEYLGHGDQILFSNSTRSSSSYYQKEYDQVYVQARITAKDQHYAWIVVNPTLEQQSVTLVLPKIKQRSGTEVFVSIVDESTHDDPWKEITIMTTGVRPAVTLDLERFAVAIAILPSQVAVALDK